MPRGLVVRALTLSFWLGLALLALTPGPARADNDYYDNVTGGANARAPAPRVAVQSADFELVAVVQAKQLVIFLDRFDDGSPVDNAAIEISAGDQTLHASRLRSGVYLATADWL